MKNLLAPFRQLYKALWSSLLLSGLFAITFSISSQASSLSAQQILSASDAVRNPDFAFSLINTVTEYRQSKAIDSSSLQVYAKVDNQTGQFLNLVRYLSPARDLNKLILMNGKTMWFYDPASKASIRLSPQQRLLGQASNGDVVTANLARDYQAKLATEEKLIDGDKQERPTYKLELLPQNEAAVYQRIVLWVDTQQYRPLKARFYSANDSLLKTAFFRRYQLIFGTQRPTETIIIDGLDSSWITVMRYSDWRQQDLPESWFQRDYLSSFRAD